MKSMERRKKSKATLAPKRISDPPSSLKQGSLKNPSPRAASKPRNKKNVKNSVTVPSREISLAALAESHLFNPPPPPFSKRFPRHGETQVVAFLRDPHCLHVYWEVAEESLGAMKNQLGASHLSSGLVLRLFRSEMEGEKLLRKTA